MKIYTITLNPAFDIHASAETLTLGKENFACVTNRDAGGKGINISRALAANRIENTAVAVLGRDNSADFVSLLRDYGVNYVAIERKGRIRENLTMHTSDGETRISFSGFSLDSSVLDEISDMIDADADTVVTFTGSVPSGVEISECKNFLNRLKRMGAKIVVDSKSFTLDDLIDVKPWLIKPNGEEIEVYSHKEVKKFEDCKDIATELCGRGIENVMISLGDKGAMLVNDGVATVAVPPSIVALSTVGAGDSTIAGFISAYSSGESIDKCLARAVAYGTAACLTRGTTPPKASDVEKIIGKVEIFSI